MDNIQLNSVLAVGTCLSFSKAALQTSFSQSAVSKHVAAVEKELGVKLFNRKPHSCVTLTAAGEALLPDMQVCFEAYQSLIAHTNAICSEANNHLRISCHANIGTLGEDELITDFGAIHPEIRIEELVDKYGRPAGKAALEGIDLGFSMLREEDFVAMQKQRELSVLPLREFRPKILLPKFHKAAQGDKVDLRELRDETFLFRAPPGISMESIDDKLLQLFISACAGEGFSPNISFVQLRSTTVFNMVSAGMGILLLMSPPYTLPENTVLLPLSKDYYSVIFAAYCYKDNKSPALRSFLDFLRQRTDYSLP